MGAYLRSWRDRANFPGPTQMFQMREKDRKKSCELIPTIDRQGCIAGFVLATENICPCSSFFTQVNARRTRFTDTGRNAVLHNAINFVLFCRWKKRQRFLNNDGAGTFRGKQWHS